LAPALVRGGIVTWKAAIVRLLILGGTRFVGRWIALEALRRGHAVTVFNRGTRPPPGSGIETIAGDRRRDLARLDGRSWDACVDTSGYVPGQVRAAAERLARHVAHYTYVSTLSVYADSGADEYDESAPVATIDAIEVERFEPVEPAGPNPADSYGDGYGALKALCESTVRATVPAALVVRPGLIVGEHDYAGDRFTYWPARIAEGGEVLAPGSRDSRLQMIDVRDLAEWIVTMIESAHTGTFNATGPAISMGSLLERCREVANPAARLVWIPDQFLLEQKVTPFVELPLWIPARIDPGAPMRADIARARALGLRSRPIADTIRSTLAWHRSREEPPVTSRSLDRARERALLDAWHATQERP
jgi:nucleoside-diphosphate-sugar epimerase